MSKASLIMGWWDMKGLGIEENLGQDITPKVGNGLNEMAMGKGMVQKKRKGQVGPIDKMEPRVKFTIPPRNQERMVNISQQKVPVMDKMGMGEMKVKMIKGNFKVPNMTLRIRRMRKVIQKIPVS